MVLGIRLGRHLGRFVPFGKRHKKSHNVQISDESNSKAEGRDAQEKAMLAAEKKAIKSALNRAAELRISGKVFEAVEQLNSLQSEFPGNSAYFKQFANLLALAGKFEEAVDYFKVLIVEKPNDITLKLRLVDCYSGLKQHQNAIDVLRRLLPDAGQKEDTVSARITHHQNFLNQVENPVRTRIAEGQKKFSEVKICLSREQSRVLVDLQNTGIAFTSVSSLLKDTSTWENGLDEYKAFEADERVVSQIEKIMKCEDFENDSDFKASYVPSRITYEEFFGVLDSDKAISKVLMDDKILEIAWSYYGSACKLRHPHMWIDPNKNKNNRSGLKGSQLWHRDQEDASILKCFIYYSDIDEKTGATDYVLRSCERFQNSEFSFHPFPFTSGYPNQKFFGTRISKDKCKTAVGKAGTIVFVDTNGFHRGGDVDEGRRHIAMCTFVRPHSPVFEMGKCLSLGETQNLSALQKYSCL